MGETQNSKKEDKAPRESTMKRQFIIHCIVFLCLVLTSPKGVLGESVSDRFGAGLASGLDWLGMVIPDNTDPALIGFALGMGGITGGSLASGWAAAAVGAAAATGWAPVIAGIGGVAVGAGLSLAVLAGGTALYNWLRNRDFDGGYASTSNSGEEPRLALAGHESATTTF